MNLSPDKLSEVYERTALEEVAEKYRNEGYEVTLESQIGEFWVDMMVKKGNEVILIEAINFRESLRQNEDRKRRMKQLRKAAKEIPGAKTRLVLIAPPENKRIQIEGIEKKLTEYFTRNFPSELSNLASRVRMGNVTDIEIQTLETSSEGMRITGYASISVDLDYESERVEMYESFPVEFDITLNSSQEVEKASKFLIDTAAYYE
ncbi:MAG: hypothetical protein AAF632_25115 [Bacteroidota bacterium]